MQNEDGSVVRARLSHGGGRHRAEATRSPKLGRSFAGIACAGIGIALLAGGATFSTWSDTVTIEPVTITAGTLSMALTDSQVWQDTTAGYASAINPATFYFTPGDTITMTQKFTTVLTGNNMSAALGVAAPTFTTGQAGITATYSAGREGVGGVVIANNVAVGIPSKITVGAESASYWVTVTFSYAADAATSDVNVSAVLGNIDITLNQIVE